MNRDSIEGLTKALQGSFSTAIDDLPLEDLMTAVATGNLAEESILLKGFDGLATEVQQFLSAVIVDVAGRELAKLEIDSAGIFDLVNEDAIAYARDRGAELVGRRWEGEILVDNPNAEWAITDTTRQGIKDLIEKAYTDGLSNKQLAQEIEASYEFSAERAQMIAHTETAMASIQGSLVGWKRAGIVTHKQWLLSADHDREDECDDNADAEAVPLDDDFPDGSEGPPAHPNCWCSMAGLIEDEER